MASDILHIKDSYYFEIPKFMWRSHRKKMGDFPGFWIRNDDEFQKWEAGRLYDELGAITNGAPEKAELLKSWEHWQHERNANYAKPLDVYLEEHTAKLETAWLRWRDKDQANADRTFEQYLRVERSEFTWFGSATKSDGWASKWKAAKEAAGGGEAVSEFAKEHHWDEHKVEHYNAELHGKILIPQPFGQLRNLYQTESGLGVSKFMIIQVVIALVLIGLFSSLARRLKAGEPPKGRLWNLLEAILLFVRDGIAKPAMGEKDAPKYTPLLWTVFLFILGCNVMGLLPWAGAPTGEFAVTGALAFITLATGWVFGTIKFGPVGFWLNLIPGMELPLWIAIPIKPMLFLIELLGFLIKHMVLAIRLLANMVAGHLVLLGIMGLAFSIAGASSSGWQTTAVIAVLASTAFSLLEVLVALLQAYLFTFLSALFIASATHHH